MVEPHEQLLVRAVAVPARDRAAPERGLARERVVGVEQHVAAPVVGLESSIDAHGWNIAVSAAEGAVARRGQRVAEARLLNETGCGAKDGSV